MKFNTRFVTAAAVAIAMALGGAVAQASTLTVAATQLYSLEGQQLSGAAAAQTVPDMTLVFGADYATSDNIDLTIGGAALAASATASALLTPANLACTPPAGLTVVLSYVTQVGNVVKLRISTATGPTGSHNATTSCVIKGVAVTAASLTSLTTITAAWQAFTAAGGIAFDASIPSPTTLASVIDQFSVTGIVAFNGVIDVNTPSLRTNFTVDKATRSLARP